MQTYVCKKLLQEMEVDGRFDKSEWQAVEGMQLVETATGGKPRQETVAKVAWSEKYLYVVFQCKDTFINATLTEYNSNLYDEEVVEIFIDDDRDQKTYLELEVNPLNAVLHYYIQNDLNGTIYQYARTLETVKSAVQRDDEKGTWSAEMAIPMDEFGTAPNIPPKLGDRWGVNLYRIDRPENGEDEYSAWSPTGKINFHMPSKFGELVFGDEATEGKA